MMSSVRRVALRAALIGVAAGALAGACVMYISWTENTQLEIHDGEGRNVDWSYWLTLGASWGVPAFVLVGLVAFAALLAWNPGRHTSP